MTELARFQERAEALAAERDSLAAANGRVSDVLDANEKEFQVQVAQRLRARGRGRFAAGFATFLASAVVSFVGLQVPDAVTPRAYSCRVVSVAGAAPAQVGDDCRVELSRRVVFGDAAATVECGGRRLYGSDRFMYELLHCDGSECEDPDPIAVDGSPGLLLILDTGAVVLSDGASWRLDLESQ